MSRQLTSGVLRRKKDNLIKKLAIGFKFDDLSEINSLTTQSIVNNVSIVGNGKIGSAAEFGVDNLDYIEISPLGKFGEQLHQAKSITMMAWLYPYSLADGGNNVRNTVLVHYNRYQQSPLSVVTGFNFQFRNNGKLLIANRSRFEETSFIADTEKIINANEWTHIAIQANFTEKSVIVYKNGEIFDSYFDILNFSQDKYVVDVQEQKERIGTQAFQQANRGYHGIIDEFYIFNKKLTELEVKKAMLGI